MKVEYQEPTVMDYLDAAIAQAYLDDRRIKSIKLNEAELKEFCDSQGFIFTKESGYTYKNYKVIYDWDSDRTELNS